MIQTLSDKLLAVLWAYEWAWQPFVEVSDYHTLETTGYPYLTFEPVGFDSQIEDSCNNLVTYRFQVLIFQEITETWWRKEAKEIISKAIKDVKDILFQNYTLDGLALEVIPVLWTITPFITQSGKALVAELQVNIRVIEFIQ